MIYTVTVSPSLDYYMPLDTLKKGEVNRTENARFIVGGKGINAAKTLNSLGMSDVICLGFIAGFTGDEIAARCGKEGLKADFVRLSNGNSRINVKLSEETDSGVAMTEINAAAPEITENDTERLLIKLQKIQRGDYLLLSGSTPEIGIYKAAAAICKTNGGRLIVDSEGETLRELLSEKPFLIKPNHFEFSDLCGVSITDDRGELEKLLEKTPVNAENVLISIGKHGAILASESGETLYVPAPQGRAKNTVGAGDTMLAAFLYKFMETGDYKKALDFAVLAASKKVFGN
jgi:1-phosphofructokinase